MTIFFQIEFDGIEIKDANSAGVTTIQGSFSTAVEPGIAAYVDDVSAAESDGTATVPVTLSRAPSDDVSVEYRTEAVTALAGTDYVETSGTLTINSGNTQADISVGLIADANDENPETLNIGLSNPMNAVLGRSTSTITLVDGSASTCQ